MWQIFELINQIFFINAMVFSYLRGLLMLVKW